MSSPTHVFCTAAMEAVDRLIARDASAVAALADAGFFRVMPIDRQTVFRACHFMLDLATHAADRLTGDYKQQFIKIIAIDPDRGLAVLEHCV